MVVVVVGVTMTGDVVVVVVVVVGVTITGNVVVAIVGATMIGGGGPAPRTAPGHLTALGPGAIATGEQDVLTCRESAGDDEPGRVVVVETTPARRPRCPGCRRRRLTVPGSKPETMAFN